MSDRYTPLGNFPNDGIQTETPNRAIEQINKLEAPIEKQERVPREKVP